jgi:hypothetical protein
MATNAADLYEQDFYACNQQQAEALRTQFNGDNRLDEHLAQEVADLGKSELHAVESFIEHIIAHLLKLDDSGQAAPRAHWRAEIVNFRQNIDRKISPSVRRKIMREFAELYRRVRQTAAVGALVHEPDLIGRLPKICPCDWDTIWHRDVLSEAGVDLGDTEDNSRGRYRGATSVGGQRAVTAPKNK